MVKFVLKALSFLPLRINHILGMSLGWCCWVFNTEVKIISHKSIKKCLTHLNKQQQDIVLKKSLIELGKTILESANIWFEPLSKNLKRIQTQGKCLLNTNKPIIILAPHLGCWEIIGNYLASKHQTTILYKPLKNKKSNELLVKTRESRGYQLAGANKKGVIKLQKALLKKQWIGILPDQNPGKYNGITVDFFAAQVLTMTLLVKLARKNNIDVVSAWAERLDKSKGYVIRFEKVDVISETNDLLSDCLMMNKTIEKMILQKPQQYQWSYNRFKK